MSKVLVPNNLGKDFIIDPLTKRINIDRSKDVTQVMMEQAINGSIAALIGGAPESMNTLKAISDEVEKLKNAKPSSTGGSSNSADNTELNSKLDAITAKLTELEKNASPYLVGNGRPDKLGPMGSKPVGTLYIDKDNTDGASIWIKKADAWAVMVGDTGWVRLKKTSSIGNNIYIDMRRIGDLIQFAFGGGSWGFFGIKGRTESGFDAHRAFDTNKGCKITNIGGIPEGFRLSASIAGTIFKDYKAVYGTYYVGGVSDSNFMALGFNTEIPEKGGITDIRFSPVTGVTTQQWPQLETLRTQNYIK